MMMMMMMMITYSLPLQHTTTPRTLGPPGRAVLALGQGLGGMHHPQQPSRLGGGGGGVGFGGGHSLASHSLAMGMSMGEHPLGQHITTHNHILIARPYTHTLSSHILIAHPLPSSYDMHPPP